jgi:DNA-binding NarL/FixJ family response regulator
MRVLIVDDQVLFRDGLRRLLAEEADFEVIGQAGHVKEAIELTLKLKPDLVLLDLSLPDGSGFDALRAIVEQRPETAVVILSVHAYEQYMVEAIRIGAMGYIEKSAPFASLVAALRGIRQGQPAVSRTMAARLVEEVRRLGQQVQADPSALGSLTERERQVLALLGSGASNDEIAGQLVISKNTVKVHVHNVLGKLNLKNRAQLVHFARRYNFDKHKPQDNHQSDGGPEMGADGAHLASPPSPA